MVSEKHQRDIPYCSIFLVAGAIFFHTLTLVGNCKNAHAIQKVGNSVTGWSGVGLGLSEAFGKELNDEIEKIQTHLTEAIVKIQQAQHNMDSLLSMFGVSVDAHVNKTVSLLMEKEELTSDDDPMGTVMTAVVGGMSNLPKLQEVNGLLKHFLDEITPALEVVGQWITKFGPKIQAFVSQMGTTLDRSQKSFDKMMQHFMSSTGADTMMFETFHLYDLDKDGVISLEEINEVGSTYAINAYQGESGKKLFEKYAGKSKFISEGHEFEAFADDTAAPKAMAILLRAYAQKMAQVGGLVSKATKRQDMSYAISQYLQLTCARNLTKVGWVGQMLTNGTLPEEFTATVLIQLALEKGSPNALTDADIGGMAVGAMVTNNMSAVVAAVELVSQPEVFSREGFDLSTQPKVVETVSKWVADGPMLWKKLAKKVGVSSLEVADSRSMHAVSLEKVLQEMPRVAKMLSQKYLKKHKQQKAAGRIAERQDKFKTKTEQLLLLHLTGGHAMTDTAKVKSAADQVVNGGVPCVPETLNWAKWLAANASTTAERLQNLSYDYSKTSSSTSSAFNVLVESIVKKTSSFIGVMESYSTPAGIARLKKQVDQFSEHALNDVMHVVEDKIVTLVTGNLGVSCSAASSNDTKANVTALAETRSSTQTKAGTQQRAQQLLDLISVESSRRSTAKEARGIGISNVWAEVQTVMSEVLSLMPSAVNTIATAKSEVQQIHTNMKSIFSVLDVKGPTIFRQAGLIYKMLWVIYWLVLVPFCLAILLYSFWANGWCGGPTVNADHDYEAPQTFTERLVCCYRSCIACTDSCCHTSFCFWSFIIMLQIVALLLFVVSILFTIVGGIDMFLASGCEQIYVIVDNPICQNSIEMLQTWLPTFQIGPESSLNPMSAACMNNDLLLCKQIKEDLMDSAMYTIVGSFLACIFTFQMVFDAAMLHERARWLRITEQLTKDA